MGRRPKNAAACTYSLTADGVMQDALAVELFDVNQFAGFGDLIIIVDGSLRGPPSAAMPDLRGVYDACLCCGEGVVVS
jgi:hypothetical protein